MADYELYAESCGVKRPALISAIQAHYPHFGKMQMSLACNPERNALQLIPAAEDILVDKFGPGPGLGISPKLHRRKYHENKNKPNRLCVRVDDNLRSQVQDVYDQMCFATMQDFLEAAIAEFCQNHRRVA